MWEALGKRFSLFAQKSNIHGFKYIVNKKENELSRLFWVIVIIISGGCLYLLLLPVIQRSEQIGFTPDTLYLDWTTAFPAVTVCETYQTGDATKRFKKFYPELSLVYNKLAYYSSLLYGEGRYSPKLSVPCGEEIPCDLPWRNMSEKVRRGYDELMADCVYNGQSFPCSQHFHVVDSEHGPCFSFNTLQNKKSSENGLFILNRTTGPTYISFHLLSEAEVSVHSNEELSTNALDPDLKVQVSTNVKHSSQVELLVSTVEMRNNLMLHFQGVEERMCRFPYEVPRSFIHSYLVYSFGACKLARETEITFNHCGCIHPIRDLSYKEKYCNFTGLNCLLRYEVDKFLKHDADADDCTPSCVESELKIIHKSISEYGGWYHNGIRRSLVTVRLASLPTLRYQRNMLRADLDLVGGEEAELYRNRKHYFSINVQTICNANIKIMDIVARWLGRAHDSTIFNSCYRKIKFEAGAYGNAHLVVPRRGLCLHNTIHAVFPVLAMGMRVKLDKTLVIIVATAVLHNILRCCGEDAPWEKIISGQIRVNNMNQNSVQISGAAVRKKTH